jgi:hypothetical protein
MKRTFAKMTLAHKLPVAAGAALVLLSGTGAAAYALVADTTASPGSTGNKLPIDDNHRSVNDDQPKTPAASDDGTADQGRQATEVGDDRGGAAEPGDDNGGRATEVGDDRGSAAEPGDDNGGRATEVGDDRGGAAEPGDDKGGAAEPGDDSGHDSTDDSSGSGSGSDDSGSHSGSGGDDSGSGGHG